MRTQKTLLMALISIFLLNACGSNVGAAPLSEKEILSMAYTAIALTATSQPIETQVVPPTATATPTPTPTMMPTATVFNQPHGIPENYSSGETSSCDSSIYVSDVNIPDGTVFAPGEVFTKTWKIKNNGSCTWNKFYAVAFSSGDNMSGATTSLRRQIPPNGTGTISVELTAPETAGTYTGYWVMINSNGTAFGSYVYVEIVVVAEETTEE